MADVHEEAQLGFAHLLGVDMLLELQTGLLLLPAVADIVLDGHCQGHQI